MIELATGVVLFIALVHLAWAAGVLWPAKDSAQLAQWVLGGEAGIAMPGRAACMGVALVLGGLAMVWLGAARGEQSAPWMRWVTGVSWLGVGVFALRGLGGFFERRFRPSIKSSPYAKMNIMLYSPLCLALAALVATDLLQLR